jgi:hypothetical protein
VTVIGGIGIVLLILLVAVQESRIKALERQLHVNQSRINDLKVAGYVFDDEGEEGQK